MPQVRVLETANNPGDALTIPLAGAPTSFRPWLAALGSGARDTYTMVGSDGQFEWGTGYATAGALNTFTRELVLGGSAGAGTRVNFTGQVDVFCEFLPERVPALDANGKLSYANMPEALGARLISNSPVAIPNGVQALMDWNAVSYSNLFPDLVAPTSGYTLSFSGLFLIIARVTFAANTTGFRSMALLRKGAIFVSVQQPASAVPCTLQLQTVVPLAALDSLQLSLNQTSGGVLYAGGNGFDEFSIVRMRG